MSQKREKATPNTPETRRNLMGVRALSAGEPSKKRVKTEETKTKLSLFDLSYPPTDDELNRFEDLDPATLPVKYRRPNKKRIFVNSEVKLEQIKMIGFDMDWTLAQYKSPQYEELAYGLAVEALVGKGYPASVRSIKYDHSFGVRGMLVDKRSGNVLKVDSHQNIRIVVHGMTKLTLEQIAAEYPTLHVHNDELGKRYAVLDTLFAMPEVFMFCSLINLLERAREEASEASDGAEAELLMEDNAKISYSNLYQDVRDSIDQIHRDGSLKRATTHNLPHYVRRDKRIGQLFDRLRKAGKKVFLLTNSGYDYTNKIMSYMIEGHDGDKRSWKDYLDIIIVASKKPKFFTEGRSFRKVDPRTGKLRVGVVGDKFEQGVVYSGGNLKKFNQMTGSSGSDVLYVGDHIFGDIIRSKRARAWRTLFIVPELDRELECWTQCLPKYRHLINLQFIRAEMYRDLHSDATIVPDTKVVSRHIQCCLDDIARAYNPHFGELFRCGVDDTFFGAQVTRFADLYASDCLNLIHYPTFYEFTKATVTTRPHERLLTPNQEEEQAEQLKQVCE